MAEIESMNTSNVKVREKFERWAQGQFETKIDFFLEWQGNCYLNDEIDAMWEGWKGCMEYKVTVTA